MTYSFKFKNIDQLQNINKLLHCAYIIVANKICYFKYNDHNNHAEYNVCEYFKRNKVKLRNCEIDIVVIRITSSKLIAESRPCLQCIIYLLKYCGLNIKYVYYSNYNRCIVRERLNKMLFGNIHISERHFYDANMRYNLIQHYLDMRYMDNIECKKNILNYLMQINNREELLSRMINF